MRPFYIIQPNDVGQQTIHAFGRVWFVSNHWGQTMVRDIGKRVYETSPSVLQIENDEQFAKRNAA